MIPKFYHNQNILTIGMILLLLSPPTANSNDTQLEILWDSWGVPHIDAPSDRDLFFAFGYAQMQCHADLILQLYGQARGRASEYWGEDHLDSDEWVWLNGIPARAREWYDLQTEPSKGFIDAFVAGMNQYASDHPDTISESMKIVLPFRGTDVIAHLQRVGIFHNVTYPAVQYNADEDLEEMATGSNGWAIAPQRSASGNAMLLLNPHLPWSDLFTLFEAHLVSPNYQVYGAAVVGTPIPSFAFNDNIAWTHTVNTHDGEDLYELTLANGGYLWDSVVRPFDYEERTLKVKQPDGSFRTVVYPIRRSIHGPVIAERDGKAVALRVVGLDRPFLIDQYWRMGQAQTLEQFKDALRMMQLPTFTVLYAGRDGHIMHFFGGLTPIRPIPDLAWDTIVPGDTSATLWTEIHPFEDMPRIEDPASGWLQNCNDPPWTTTFPMEIDPDDYPGYIASGTMTFRAQQAVRLLGGDESITFDEMIEYKHTTRMELAGRLLDDLLPAAHLSKKKFVRDAATVLEAWDRTCDEKSKGGILFELWIIEMADRVDEFEAIFAHQWDIDHPLTTPDGLSDIDVALDALETAAVVLDLFKDSLAVPWGEIHHIKRGQIDIPTHGAPDPFGVLRLALYTQTRYDRFETVAGDSFAAVVEFSHPVRAEALLTYGNATQPNSPHKDDQLELYSKKQFREVWFTREDIEAHTLSRTTLPSPVSNWSLH